MTKEEKLQAENDKLKQQLKDGYHCSSFGMCGDAAEKFDKLIAENKQLRIGLEDVIRFTPNDTDFEIKPTRDECLKEIKWFAEQVLKGK